GAHNEADKGTPKKGGHIMRIQRIASASILALAALGLLATPPDASATPEFAKQWLHQVLLLLVVVMCRAVF
ncbi:MAG: hypothetical protein ACE1Z9_03360, partial [Acidimicrobiia bacterium]